jgi:predicted GNAT superfamily acetyltransferase
MVAYHENFYGVLEDGYNSGDSDRVVLRWDLASPRAVDAAEGRADGPSADAGCVVLKANPDGAPATYDAEGDVLLAWLPESIVRVRAENPDRAATWRAALRSTVGRALADGFRGESITRDGWLVLRR